MYRPRLAIKGGADNDAVLCTSDRTYNIRSVTLSNSVLVITPPPDADGNSDRVVIQDSLSELLELVPTVPRLHRLNTLLKEHEWEEGHEEEDENFGAVGIFSLLFGHANFRSGGPSFPLLLRLGEAETIHGRPSSSGTPSQRAGTRASTQGEARPHLRWQVSSRGILRPS